MFGGLEFSAYAKHGFAEFYCVGSAVTCVVKSKSTRCLTGPGSGVLVAPLHPYLIEFSFGSTPIRLPSYGTFLAIAFTVAYLVSLRRARRHGIDPKEVDRIMLVSLIAVLGGSRLFQLNGHSLCGAFIAQIVALFFYCRFRKTTVLLALDLFTPTVFIAIFFARIGCFMAGCCEGMPTSLPWGVEFNHPR